MKKILAVLLIAFLLAGVCAATALAAYSESLVIANFHKIDRAQALYTIPSGTDFVVIKQATTAIV
ncbi:MAG: hypothetical protein PHD32_02420 [Eubacteriales bacterium]|nr:hypothetical protein [Eubacteriales bacterium]